MSLTCQPKLIQDVVFLVYRKKGLEQHGFEFSS
jgi:hypothetical protein